MQKPSKPRPDFPLTAHNNGQWCKWIKPKGAPRSQGRIVMFGPWSDPDGAEALYLRERAEWEAGRVPRASVEGGPSQTPDLEEISDRWLVKQEALAKAATRASDGGMSRRSYMDKKRAIKEMFKHWSKKTDPAKLMPDDFELLRAKLAQDVGPATLSQRIIHIRAMFRWAESQRLIDRLPFWGDKFRNVTAGEKMDARIDNERINGQRKFAIDEAHAILREAQKRTTAKLHDCVGSHVEMDILVGSRWLYAANLLAANTAANGADISALAFDDVDLKKNRWLDTKRVKTGVWWQATLWPETIDAIEEYLTVRPAVRPEALKAWREERASRSRTPAWKAAAAKAEPIFVTANGYPLVHDVAHYDANGTLVKNTPTSAVQLAMGKLLTDLGIKAKNVNFGAWRHTFFSIATESGQETFVKRIMAQSVGRVTERYFKPTPGQLCPITDLVREKLLPAELRRAEPTKPAEDKEAA